MTDKITASTQHFAWISSPDNSRTAQLKAGRLYNRINLTTSAMGLAQHPMSQILQEYEDMLPLQDEFKRAFDIPKQDTVQMLFRLGLSARTPLAPRRDVADIITS